MKTIKERASSFMVQESDIYYKNDWDLDWEAVETGYETGATEQREIDIQRAVEWLKENIITERHEMDCGRHTEEYYEATYYGKTEELINEFEEAMKGGVSK